MATTSAGSQSAIEAVQLFSMPQHRHAQSTSIEPAESDSPASGSTASSAHEAVIAAMPAQSLGDILSPKSARAKSAVATISKLLSSDTLSGAVVARPAINSSGAHTSRATMPAA